MSYFVFDLKKVKTKDEFNKVVLGHNLRRRHTSQNQNIDFSKSSKNLILKDFDGTITDYIEKCNQAARKAGGRALKKNSSFAFNLVIDCSQMDGWPEKKYIKYLEDAYKWIQEHFSGQDILAASIHVDETKPHLHVTISYFNSEIGRWNQRNLAKQKKTDLNTLLKRFERDVAAKYGLKRGDGATTRKKLLKTLKSHNLIKNVPVKTGTFSTTEKKFIAPSALKFFAETPAKLKADNIQLKNEIVKLKNELFEKERSLRELTMRLRADQEKKEREIKKVREQASKELAAEKQKIFDYAAEKIREEKSRADKLEAALAAEKRKNAELKEKMAELFIKYNIKPGISGVSAVGD